MKLFRDYPNSLCHLKEGNFGRSWKRGPRPSSDKDCRILSPCRSRSQGNLKFWSFLVVAVQVQQRNVQKSVMYVQSCCFALNLLLFWRSFCRRRCILVRSLLRSKDGESNGNVIKAIGLTPMWVTQDDLQKTRSQQYLQRSVVVTCLNNDWLVDWVIDWLKIVVANHPVVVNRQLYTCIIIFCLYFFAVTVRLRRETSTFHVLNNKKTIFSVSFFELTYGPLMFKEFKDVFVTVAFLGVFNKFPNVGWVCCWFSPLLRENFPRVLQFSLSLKARPFKLCIVGIVKWSIKNWKK